ncbi:MAG: dTMP kinase [Clostridia bacterium]|nr:dTMP kinase [Clostridia bacterium]
MFITFEGPDGSGKSTQIRRLKEYLEQQGCQVLVTNEPGDTAIGAQIRDLLLNPIYKGITPETEALLYAADRAQHVRQVVKPALAEGKVVICDRYIDSTIAYQYFGRQLSGEFMGTITKYAIDGLMPEATVILELSPEAAEKRYTQRAQAKQADYDVPDRLEQERAEFKERVNQGFKYMAENYSHRIITIDASGTIDQVWDAILAGLKERGVLC